MGKLMLLLDLHHENRSIYFPTFYSNAQIVGTRWNHLGEAALTCNQNQLRRKLAHVIQISYSAVKIMDFLFLFKTQIVYTHVKQRTLTVETFLLKQKSKQKINQNNTFYPDAGIMRCGTSETEYPCGYQNHHQ